MTDTELKTLKDNLWHSADILRAGAKEAHTNQQINSIILDDKQNLEWLYFSCKLFKPIIELYGATGATMTNLSKIKFERLKIIVPTKDIHKKFHNLIKIIFEEYLFLKKQNAILARQRDALLPRLMSGKLEVKTESV